MHSCLEVSEVSAVLQGPAVKQLEDHFHLMETVVSSLESYERNMRSMLPAAEHLVVRSLEEQALLLAHAGIDFDTHAKAVAGHLQFFYHMALATGEPISPSYCER